MHPLATPKTYRVKSFGCQMNVYDGERMGELLSAQGLAPAPEGEEAELVVLNTCHIREKATEKVYSDIGRLVKGGRKAGRQPMIAVAGCVAQAEGEEIMARAPAVSMVVGPQAYHRLPEMLDRAVAGERATDTDMPAIAKFAALPERRKIGPAAFLTVQEGCDKFCTYCVVPYTRGTEISRPWDDIVAEARALVEVGAREIVLLGQNVNAWSGSGRGLADLIREIAAIDGLERIRYTTSHPADMSAALIAAHGEIDKLMPYLHLPVQSGSDRLLRAMNRSHSVESYLDTIEKVRAARPDIAISGDFIVGFPGETEEDFEVLLDWLGEAKLDRVGCFRFEPVAGAAANALPDPVPPEVKEERWHRLMQAQQPISARNLAKKIGRRVPVILDETSGRTAKGRSMWDAPEIDGEVHLRDAGYLEQGDIVEILVEDADEHDLYGVPR